MLRKNVIGNPFPCNHLTHSNDYEEKGVPTEEYHIYAKKQEFGVRFGGVDLELERDQSPARPVSFE